jgi:hypothetical protein
MRALVFVLPFLLCCEAFGQWTAGDIVKSDLIDAPESVQPGAYFVVKTPPKIAYKIEPELKDHEFFAAIEEETGKRIIFILHAKAPGYKISINHVVVHPTLAEVETAPLDNKGKFKEWLEKNSADEVYVDTHTVTVGGPGPDPDPDPDPDPNPKPGPTDPLAKKVYDAAIANKLPASECQQVATNLRSVISEAVATSMTVQQMQAKVKSLNAPITGGKAGWEAWEKTLVGTFTVTNKEQTVEAYEKIAEGLGAVQ